MHILSKGAIHINEIHDNRSAKLGPWHASAGNPYKVKLIKMQNVISQSTIHKNITYTTTYDEKMKWQRNPITAPALLSLYQLCGVAGSYIPGLSGLMVMQLAQAIIKSSSA